METAGNEGQKLQKKVEITKQRATKAECFEITEKLIKYRKDADLKNK